MAKLKPEITEIINRLEQESLSIVDEASALEFKIFERFGETELALSYMDEMKNFCWRLKPRLQERCPPARTKNGFQPA